MLRTHRIGVDDHPFFLQWALDFGVEMVLPRMERNIKIQMDRLGSQKPSLQAALGFLFAMMVSGESNLDDTVDPNFQLALLIVLLSGLAISFCGILTGNFISQRLAGLTKLVEAGKRRLTLDDVLHSFVPHGVYENDYVAKRVRAPMMMLTVFTQISFFTVVVAVAMMVTGHHEEFLHENSHYPLLYTAGGFILFASIFMLFLLTNFNYWFDVPFDMISLQQRDAENDHDVRLLELLADARRQRRVAGQELCPKPPDYDIGPKFLHRSLKHDDSDEDNDSNNRSPLSMVGKN